MRALVPKNGDEAPKLAALIARKAAGHKLAMLDASEEYSSNLTETALKILAEKKITPDIVMKMSDKDVDFSALISKLKDRKIDVVFLGFWPKSRGRLPAGGNGQLSSAFHRRCRGLDGRGFENRRAANERLCFHDVSRPAAQPRRPTGAQGARGKAYHQSSLRGWAYLVVQVYAAAVRQAGSTESDKVMNVLKTEKFDTVMVRSLSPPMATCGASISIIICGKMGRFSAP